MTDNPAQAWKIPEEANAVLMVPLHYGQQVLAVLQSQLADVDQALLIEGTQNGPSVASHRGLLGLQGGVQTCIPQVWHGQRWHHHCKVTAQMIPHKVQSSYVSCPHWNWYAICDQDRHDPSWALAELPPMRADSINVEPLMGLKAEKCDSNSIW